MRSIGSAAARFVWLITALRVLALPNAVAAQRLTRQDSASIGRAIATYILMHSDVPLGGSLGRVIVDTVPGTLTAYAGAALRTIAPDRWRGSGGDGDKVWVDFKVDTLHGTGDTVIVNGSWTRCQPSATAGNERAVHYRAVRSGAEWTVVSREGWLVGRAECRT